MRLQNRKHDSGITSFNPRTPCGVRPFCVLERLSKLGFQSTHSLRSATKFLVGSWLNDDVSIHALLAECDSGDSAELLKELVSIHALLAECDSLASSISAVKDCFNPRTPCGVRHGEAYIVVGEFEVSIHALLAECDSASTLRSATPWCFNPRTPCGVRPVFPCLAAIRNGFQSTHSLRSATLDRVNLEVDYQVSIHALLAECDTGRKPQPKNNKVSIHALLAECDYKENGFTSRSKSFNPRTPCGVRPLSTFLLL